MNYPIKTEHLYNLFLKEYPDVLTTKDLQSILSISGKTVLGYYIQVKSKASKWEETSVSPRSTYSNISA